jgi:hypothetical protein
MTSGSRCTGHRNGCILPDTAEERPRVARQNSWQKKQVTITEVTSLLLAALPWTEKKLFKDNFAVGEYDSFSELNIEIQHMKARSGALGKVQVDPSSIDVSPKAQGLLRHPLSRNPASQPPASYLQSEFGMLRAISLALIFAKQRI